MPPERVHDEEKLILSHLIGAGAEDRGGSCSQVLPEITPYIILSKPKQAAVQGVKANVLKIGVHAERLCHIESGYAGYKNEAEASLIFPDGIIESSDLMLYPFENSTVLKVEVQGTVVIIKQQDKGAEPCFPESLIGRILEIHASAAGYGL